MVFYAQARRRAWRVIWIVDLLAPLSRSGSPRCGHRLFGNVTSFKISKAYLEDLLSLLVELESGGKFGAKTDSRFVAFLIPDDSD